MKLDVPPEMVAVIRAGLQQRPYMIDATTPTTAAVRHADVQAWNRIVTQGDADELLHKARQAQLEEVLRAAYELLDSVAYVAKPGDTARPLRLLRQELRALGVEQ